MYCTDTVRKWESDVKFVGEGPCVGSQEDMTRSLEFCDGRRNNCVTRMLGPGK